MKAHSSRKESKITVIFFPCKPDSISESKVQTKYYYYYYRFLDTQNDKVQNPFVFFSSKIRPQVDANKTNIVHSILVPVLCVLYSSKPTITMRKVQLEVSPTSCITSSLYLFYQSICSAWKQFSTNELAGEQQFKQWCHWRWEGEFTKATFFKYKMLRSTLYGARQMYIKDHEKATNYMPLKAHFMDESCQITEGIYWEKCVAARMDKSMHSIHSKLLPISCHAHSKKRLKNWQPQTPALK